MWRSPDGVLHTVALPDPSEPFTGPALAAAVGVLRALPADRREALLLAWADECWRAWRPEVVPFDAVVEAGFRDVPVPLAVVGGVAHDAEGLHRLVLAVGPRWRLDVLMALGDAADLG